MMFGSNETPHEAAPSPLIFTGREILISLFVALMISFGSGMAGGWIVARHTLSAHPVNAPATVTATDNTPPLPTQKKKEPSLADTISQNVVADGKGTIHYLANQLAAHRVSFESPACKNRPEGKERIDCNAYMMAMQAGLINPKAPAVEMRVRKAGSVAYVIEQDGQGGLQIVEYAVNGTAGADPSGAGFTKTATFPVAATMAAAQFIGPAGGTDSFHTPHMYMYVGG